MQSPSASAELVGRASGAALGDRLAVALPGVVAFAVAAPLLAANGGYDPPAWGWSTALLAGVAAAAVAVRQRVAVSRGELVTVGGFAGLAGWMAISARWSGDVGASVLAAERCLVYVAALAAFALLTRRGSVAAVLAGGLAAAVLTVLNGLVGILAPGAVAVAGVAQTGRLAAPVGYWNGVGIVAALGLLLALGLAARSASVAGRAAALAPLPVLGVGLYLTFSRGGALSLAAGLAIMLLLETRRWQLALLALTAGLWLAFDVLLAAGSHALTHRASPVGPATAQGHRLGLVMAVSAVGIAVCGAALLPLERRWTPSAALTQSVRRTLCVLAVGALAAPVVAYGSPGAAGRHLVAAFDARAPHGFRATRRHAARSLNAHLFSLSGNGRAQLWQAAASDVRAHPWLGSGAGTYGRWWLAHRPVSLKVRNAHNLYLETLAELGPVGLLLLLAGLGPPLVLAVARRRAPYAAVAGAGFAAFCLHAAVDWDFQLPGVTLLGLLCAAAALAATRGRRQPIRRPLRWGIGAAAVLVVVLAVAGLQGNLALARSTSAAGAGRWQTAAAQAHVAIRWTPWSEAPWRALGEARLGQGDYAGAAQAFERATRLAPGDWQAWFGLARSTTGRERLAALAHARALDPREQVVNLLAAGV